MLVASSNSYDWAFTHRLTGIPSLPWVVFSFDLLQTDVPPILRVLCDVLHVQQSMALYAKDLKVDIGVLVAWESSTSAGGCY
jgi:hypothetical protein